MEWTSVEYNALLTYRL